MIALIQGIIALIVLIFQQMIKANEEKAKKTQEIKDAIKSGDTSAITAALS
jgi:preprotein translocase subunit YajC